MVDAPSLVSHVKSTFYLLYDEYFKFYSPSLNINVQQDVPQAKPHSTNLIRDIKFYFTNQKKKKVIPDHHKARPPSFKVI